MVHCDSFWIISLGKSKEVEIGQLNYRTTKNEEFTVIHFGLYRLENPKRLK